MDFLQAPWKAYPRIPYRFLDIKDFEADSEQSKTYKYKQNWLPMVRESETWMILFWQSTINKFMFWWDDNRTPSGAVTYSTANGNKFNFWLSLGNNSNQNFIGEWTSTTPYNIGNVVTYNNNTYICIAIAINQNPETQPTYWTLTASYPQNLSPFTSAYNSNIITVNSKMYVKLYFWFAIELNDNINQFVFFINSSINGTVVKYERSASGKVITIWPNTYTANKLSDLNKIMSGYKEKPYLTTPWETFELQVYINAIWTGDFTLLASQTYRWIQAFKPNY